MNYRFVGDLTVLQEGLDSIARLLNWTLSETGVSVFVQHVDDKKMSLSRSDHGWILKYNCKAQFFRALGYLNQQKEIEEYSNFESCGFQIDLSQTNEILQLPQMHEMMCRLALMGFNLLILYMEDSFEVPEEPYFGYMRSRYTEEDLLAIEAMGEMYGIEVVPMIQGLAHLTNVLRWPPYSDMQENPNTLLVGEPKTYAYLEHVIDAATKPFHTNRIFIAMDEAFELGRGETLSRTGVYRPSFDLMREHMSQLVPMCEKRGLEFVTYGDMFMMATNPEGSVFDRLYATDRPLPDEIKKAADYPVNYCLWDYSHLDETTYVKLFERYREFGKCDYFLAGIWNWLGFGVDYSKTFATIIPGLRAAKKCNIKHVMVAAWGNDTGSENFWSDLLLGLQLFAEYVYGDEPSDSELSERFNACTGCEMNDFMELSYVDHLYDELPQPGPDYTNFSRSLLWQDMLFGRFDYHIRDNSLSSHFAKVANALEEASTRNGEYGKYFETRALCARVMEIKATMGFRIQKAYQQGNLDHLRSILDDELPELNRRVKALHDRHRELWYSVYKPLGWEVEDLRYGALMARIDSVAYRLKQYLRGEVTDLTEVTEKRLSVTGEEKMPRAYSYLRSVTPSYLEPYG